MWVDIWRKRCHSSVAEKHGMNASAMLTSQRKAYILLNVEAELDMQNPQQAFAAMGAADMVVALSAYKHHAIGVRRCVITDYSIY